MLSVQLVASFTMAARDPSVLEQQVKVQSVSSVMGGEGCVSGQSPVWMCLVMSLMEARSCKRTAADYAGLQRKTQER